MSLIGLDSTAENMARSAHQFEEISRDVMDEQKVKDRLTLYQMVLIRSMKFMLLLFIMSFFLP